MNSNVKKIIVLIVMMIHHYSLSSDHHYVAITDSPFPESKAIPFDASTASFRTDNCNDQKKAPSLQSTPRPPITVNENNSPESSIYKTYLYADYKGPFQNQCAIKKNDAINKAKAEIPPLDLGVINNNLANRASPLAECDSTISSDLTIDNSSPDSNYEPRLDNDAIKKNIMEHSTHFFIIPNSLFILFMDKLEKITHQPNDPHRIAKQVKIYEDMREEFVWGEVKKIPNNTNEPHYYLEKFIVNSIDINDLYIGNKNAFLTNKDPENIKKFLEKGLLPEHQLSLFQETLKEGSPAFLNYALAHSLILHGWTLELLETFYHSYRTAAQHLKDINTIRQANITSLQKIETATRDFDLLISSTSLKEILKKDITCKTRDFITFYNNKIADSRVKQTFYGNKELAQQYIHMILRPTKIDYNSIANRAIKEYTHLK